MSGSSFGVRADEVAGTREEVHHIGPSSDVLGFTHLPVGRQPAAGVVICSSVHADFLSNYRKEVLLAWMLCRRGLAVQRLHYRGSGNSGGRPEELSFDRLLEDCAAATEHLLARTGVGRLAFLGTRLGSIVAAATAAGYDRADLALWEPVLDTDRYFREAFRARMIKELKQGEAAARPSAQDLVRELRETGSVDVLGYTIHRPFYDTTSGRKLEAELGAAPRRVLVAQIGKDTELRRDYAGLADRWRQAGLTVQCRVVGADQSWWYVGEEWEPEEDRPGTSVLLDSTCRWIVPDGDGGAGSRRH